MLSVPVRVRDDANAPGCEGGEKGDVEVDIEVLREALRPAVVAKGAVVAGDQGLRGLCDELPGRVVERLMEVLMAEGPRRAEEEDAGAFCERADQEVDEGRFEDCEEGRSVVEKPEVWSWWWAGNVICSTAASPFALDLLSGETLMSWRRVV